MTLAFTTCSILSINSLHLVRNILAILCAQKCSYISPKFDVIDVNRYNNILGIEFIFNHLRESFSSVHTTEALEAVVHPPGNGPSDEQSCSLASVPVH